MVFRMGKALKLIVIWSGYNIVTESSLFEYGVLVFGWDMSMHKQVKVAMEANKQLEHETPTPALEVDQQNASASVGLLVFCLALS